MNKSFLHSLPENEFPFKTEKNLHPPKHIGRYGQFMHSSFFHAIAALPAVKFLFKIITSPFLSNLPFIYFLSPVNAQHGYIYPYGSTIMSLSIWATHIPSLKASSGILNPQPLILFHIFFISICSFFLGIFSSHASFLNRFSCTICGSILTFSMPFNFKSSNNLSISFSFE